MAEHEGGSVLGRFGEVRWLRDNGAGLVLGDIPPLAFDAAADGPVEYERQFMFDEQGNFLEDRVLVRSGRGEIGFVASVSALYPVVVRNPPEPFRTITTPWSTPA